MVLDVEGVEIVEAAREHGAHAGGAVTLRFCVTWKSKKKVCVSKMHLLEKFKIFTFYLNRISWENVCIFSGVMFNIISDPQHTLNLSLTDPPASRDLFNRNPEYCLGNISTHPIAPKDDKVHPPPHHHPAPKATTMVQHPLIKKGTAVRMQPASESAGYEEEQSNPQPQA